MDIFGAPVRRLRGACLEKLAYYSGFRDCDSSKNDLRRLLKILSKGNSKLAQKIRLDYIEKNNNKFNGITEENVLNEKFILTPEILDVLLALASSCPKITLSDHASIILDVIGLFLLETSFLGSSLNVFSKTLTPSPWDALSFRLTQAIMTIGIKFPKLKSIAVSYIYTFVRKFKENSSTEDSDYLITIILSLVGFLKALSNSADLFSIPKDKLLLIQELQDSLNKSFLTKLEPLVESTFINPEWQSYSVRYTYGLENTISSLQLLNLFLDIGQSFIKDFIITESKKPSILDSVIDGGLFNLPILEDDDAVQLITTLKDIAVSNIEIVEDGVSYIAIETDPEVALALHLKGSALQILSVWALHDTPFTHQLFLYITGTTEQDYQMHNVHLSNTVFQIMTIYSRFDSEIGGAFARFIPHFLVRAEPTLAQVSRAAELLASAFEYLSQDLIISTIYTLINSLLEADATVLPSANSFKMKPANDSDNSLTHVQTAGSIIDIKIESEDQRQVINERLIECIVSMVLAINDFNISTMAAAVLSQKLGQYDEKADTYIILGFTRIACFLNEREFKVNLKLLNSLGLEAALLGDVDRSQTILDARILIAQTLDIDHPLFETFLKDLLSVFTAESANKEAKKNSKIKSFSPAKQISYLIPALAELLPSTNEEPYEAKDEGLRTLFRNAWFNMVVHGYTRDSEWSKQFSGELKRIAWSTPPLVKENSANQMDSQMELNTILKRNSVAQSNLSNKKQELLTSFGASYSDMKKYNMTTIIFLATALALEYFRSLAGDCSTVVIYFVDPSLKTGENFKMMNGIMRNIIDVYIEQAKYNHYGYSVTDIAKQLRNIFVRCCHRIQSVQDAAFTCADQLVHALPSAMCQKDSTYVLLDLITLLWNSCLDADTEEYSPRSVFTSPKVGITLELSDSYTHRSETYKRFRIKAYNWIQSALNRMPYDFKSILQSYISEIDDGNLGSSVSAGRSFALEIAGTVPSSDLVLSSVKFSKLSTDMTSEFLSQYSIRLLYADPFISSRQAFLARQFPNAKEHFALEIKTRLQMLKASILRKELYTTKDVRNAILEATAFVVNTKGYGREIVNLIVSLPIALLTSHSIKLGIAVWSWMITEVPSLEPQILAKICEEWEWSIRNHLSLYSHEHDIGNVFGHKMEYAPSNNSEVALDSKLTLNAFEPHSLLCRFLSSHFQTTKYYSRYILDVFGRLLRIALKYMGEASMHPLSRFTRFEIIFFAIQFLDGHKYLVSSGLSIWKNIIMDAALSWFKVPWSWPYGSNKLRLRGEYQLLCDVFRAFSNIRLTSSSDRTGRLASKQSLLLAFLHNEFSKIAVWLDPLQFSVKNTISDEDLEKVPMINSDLLVTAWSIDPRLAINLYKRYEHMHSFSSTLCDLVRKYTYRITDIPEALEFFLNGSLVNMRYLLYWKPVSPIDAVDLFMNFRENSFVIQYAMRSIEYYSDEISFFYVPQIVQALRFDTLGYIERFILDTAKLSQLFAHQIIWNVKANQYRDEDATEPDALKPVFDRVINEVVSSFTGEDKKFFEKEFDFFSDITSISGKLKPFIKRSKAERKAKIDEEMKKIQLRDGVYLPSNPDGTVIDIDRTAGKPLQSHAKAPFMATFRIRKQILSVNPGVEGEDEEDLENEKSMKTVEVWHSAIFKVGDDCRQDMLALQLIAVFREIFNSCGLSLYVFPYRVTATAPGCGVIDVLPHSISRDMLGREAVNGLYEYYITKHGSEDSIDFQKARNNFVRSLAAYSVISYLLQFKDRHNGNIMYDDEGHILHIDFGFCFDIVPGGVKFEAAPFKLTHEMVQVMGGSTDTQSYYWFEELCVKAYLASRPYAEEIIRCVTPMLDSGLPCFKGQATIRRLRDRFVLDKSDKEAAVFMKYLIKKSVESIYTKGYDEFQRITNGIPY